MRLWLRCIPQYANSSEAGESTTVGRERMYTRPKKWRNYCQPIQRREGTRFDSLWGIKKSAKQTTQLKPLKSLVIKP
ncbi:hypothetical protein O9992_12655 [Vibrio lentus]|nr:hypothetical protein [Vibrio lentus]